MSNNSPFFCWGGCRVQSTPLHLDGHVEQVVVALTPAVRRDDKSSSRLLSGEPRPGVGQVHSQSAHIVLAFSHDSPQT